MVNERIINPKLRAIISAQWGYYGLPPSRLSSSLPAIGYLRNGGYYPRGKFQKISNALVKFIEEHGGKVMLNTHVGDPIFGDIVSHIGKDQPGRNSHGGPVCIEYANGDIAAFCTSASGHNTDSWSEYALSRDDGKTWEDRGKLPLAPAVWYGALCLMEDGRLLAGGYLSDLEDVFTYCIIHKYNKDKPEEVMILYSICYEPWLTNEYVFFVRPQEIEPNKLLKK